MNTKQNLRITIQLSLLLCFSLSTSSLMAASSSTSVNSDPKISIESIRYTGSDSCRDCHQKEHQLWQKSDHHKAMQSPTKNTVLGDFNNIEVEFHAIKTRFFKKQSNYFIETINKFEERETFPVKYTFGFDPLQQYILDTGKGHMQAFNVAWDTRPKKDGGQRWYHLQADEVITPGHPFFWQRHYQNWNSRCAECHTTGYEKNYQAKSNSFSTNFAEATVGCESCHGPAEAHVRQAKLGIFSDSSSNNFSEKLSKKKGFTHKLSKPPIWHFSANDPIANLVGESNPQYMQQCASCHSRRLPISDNSKHIYDNEHDNYHDQFALDLMSSQTYFDDGQMNDEVFVLGSFLQSKMAQAGVTCSNCHNPHSGKLKFQGNQVCTQCHIASAYDTPSHHQHKKESTGAQCVECHMPTRTYMQLDQRRDHSFVIPNGNISEIVNSPNACLSCHKEDDLLWVKGKLNNWSKKNKNLNKKPEHWSLIHLKTHNNKITFTKDKIQTEPPIVSKKLLEIINQRPTQASVNLALQQLDSNDAILRRGAISILQRLSPQQAVQYLLPLLKDPVRSVRFDAVSVLVIWLPNMSAESVTDLPVALDDYRTSLLSTADFPSSQVKLGQLAMALGNKKKAQKHYEKALTIEPNLPMAMLVFADFWRQSNNPTKEREVLENAVKTHPEFADILHQYGLYWVRKKEYKKASEWLVKATDKVDAQAHYAYVAATSLDTIEKTSNAVDLLLRANKRWPKQITLLHSLALYSIKIKDVTSTKIALSELQLLVPKSPQVQQWLIEYQ